MGEVLSLLTPLVSVEGSQDHDVLTELAKLSDLMVVACFGSMRLSFGVGGTVLIGLLGVWAGQQEVEHLRLMTPEAPRVLRSASDRWIFLSIRTRMLACTLRSCSVGRDLPRLPDPLVKESLTIITRMDHISLCNELNQGD